MPCPQGEDGAQGLIIKRSNKRCRASRGRMVPRVYILKGLIKDAVPAGGGWRLGSV
jgi:hypothetical protein